ncbi:ATP-binding cassette domain-containing protein [Ensifer adhaerens]|uniref:ATP-binding cassette domain-containing protein n=1 Tax=Ensifer adhaerens TaxID=106592 RepID=UPI000CF13412|nr:ATP-binding cassette domain-containing protein [Ensifer adhaerens]
MTDARPLFSLRDASFAVGDRLLVQPTNLEIARGEMLALVGHNGSGKSTLLKMLARQQAPSSGTIAFDGKPLDAWSSRDFARRLAYLPQQIPAAPAMTVRELAAMGRYPWHGALGRFGRDDRESVERALDRTNMLPLADRLVDTLSGGERQRAWLAMLLAQNAACLLLDEPTAALDIAHQIEVLSLVRTLSRANGLTVILVLHDINMASRFSDQIVALHSGRLIANGRPSRIMEKTTLEHIYGVQMDIIPHPSADRVIAVPC